MLMSIDSSIAIYHPNFMHLKGTRVCYCNKCAHIKPCYEKDRYLNIKIICKVVVAYINTLLNYMES